MDAVTQTPAPTNEPVLTYAPGSAEEFNQSVGAVVYFDFDKFDLSPEARAQLDKQAAWLKQYPDVGDWRAAQAIYAEAQSRGVAARVWNSVSHAHFTPDGRLLLWGEDAWLRVWAPGADPSATEPLYKASGDVSGGEVTIHR